MTTPTSPSLLRVFPRISLTGLQEVPGTRRPGQTGHYRNTIFPDASELTASPKPQTLFELVRQGPSRLRISASPSLAALRC